jgi:hypothetical protein
MTLEEFKEYAKTVTREEFLLNNGGNREFWIVIDKEDFDCPKDLGIRFKKEPCPRPIRCWGDNREHCKQCWCEAVKDIKFKDDIEKDLIEAMSKQPIIISDSVNHPSHYTHGKIETIDKIEDVLGLEGFQAYCVGNAIKYLDRYKLKNGFEDIKKAKRYLEFYIEKTEGK